MPKKNGSPLLSPKFRPRAPVRQRDPQRAGTRGAGAPYISHLMSVCALVLEYEGRERQAIAALLHDSAEDCGGRPMLETVRVMFGNDAEIVEACPDTFDTPKPDWRPRKESCC